MWQCEACNYQNEDDAQACLRCGVQHVSGEELRRPVEAASVAPRTTASDYREARLALADSVSGKGSKSSTLPVAALSLSVILLAVALYVAWSSGLFGSVEPTRGQPPAPITSLTPAPMGDAETKPPASLPDDGSEANEAPSEEIDEDPLLVLESGDAPKLPIIAKYKSILLALDEALAPGQFSGSIPRELAESEVASLDDLKKRAEEIAVSYQSFEKDAAEIAEGDATPYIEALRSAFVRRMADIVTRIGEARVIDADGTHPAYMAPDTLSTVVTAASKANAAPIRAAWDKVLAEQEEGSRNAHFGDQLAELSKYYDALRALHRDYQQKFSAAPPYTMKNGILGQSAATLLEQYDALATAIEELTVQFDTYSGGLKPESMSVRMKSIIKDFTELAQQDHLHCFTETYVIYSKDRDLNHPAYERLKGHYEFAKAHWIGFRDQYPGVYTRYETIWEQRWASD
jgi:hypothetical protein